MKKMDIQFRKTENNKESELKPFEKRMMDIGRIPNLITGLSIIIYIFYFSQITFRTVGVKSMITLIISGVTLILAMQFLIAPRTNHLITRSISSRLETSAEDRKEEEDLRSQLKHLQKDSVSNSSEIKEIKKKIDEIVEDRTNLAKELMKCPNKISIQVVLVFMIAMIIYLMILVFATPINHISLIFVLAGYLSGIYNGGIISYSYAERLCSEYTVKLTSMGLNKETLSHDKFYGMKFKNRITLFIIISYAITNTIQVMFMFMGTMKNNDPEYQMFNMGLLTMTGIIFSSILATFLYKQVTKSSYNMNETIERFLQGNMQEDLTMPEDLSNEMSYNLHMVNDIISYLQDLSSNAKYAGIGIQQQISELASTAEEVAKNSENLSYVINRSNETMSQNVKKQLGEISIHISDVSNTADVMKENVDTGFNLLQTNISKISEITQANIDTISGIKTLSDKIDSVWDSIKKIDSLAEKTRIIAFNAELEATAAGERGENFHIVANEIRRLADTITDSTYEIKEKIKSIQHSSDNLIVTSEAGTQQIREASEFFMALEEKFKELKLKSDVTAEYSKEIQNIIATQDTSFVQISSTFRQISSSFMDFTSSTKTLTDAAEVLTDIAARLSSIYKNTVEAS